MVAWKDLGFFLVGAGIATFINGFDPPMYPMIGGAILWATGAVCAYIGRDRPNQE